MPALLRKARQKFYVCLKSFAVKLDVRCVHNEIWSLRPSWHRQPSSPNHLMVLEYDLKVRKRILVFLPPRRHRICCGFDHSSPNLIVLILR